MASARLDLIGAVEIALAQGESGSGINMSRSIADRAGHVADPGGFGQGLVLIRTDLAKIAPKLGLTILHHPTVVH
jgi:hypothetical protein